MRWWQRPELALAALVLGAVAYFYQAGGWNQNSRFDLTRAMVEKRSSIIDAYEKNTGDEARRGAHFYCDKAPGVSWMAAPAWAAAWVAAGAPERPSPRLLAAGAYLGTLLAVGLPTVVAAVFLFLLARALGLSPAWSAGGALAWALGTLAWPYATLLYGHQTVAALHLPAFALLVQIRAGVASPTRARLAAVGALVGASIVVEYTAALGGAVIGLYALRVVRPKKPVLWAIAAGAVPVALLLLYHWRVFGGPLTLPYEFSTQKHRHMGWFMGLGAPDWEVLRQILVSEYRGLLYPAPWLWLTVPGTALLVADRETRGEGVACAAAILLYLWLNASLVDWHGGWALGPRYLVPALPFWVIGALGVARWATRRASPWPARSLAALAGAAVAVSVVLMLAGTAVKPEVPVYLEDPLGWVWQRFRHGALAVNTQSIDMAGAPPNGPRYAWNLGHQLGLAGHAALIPLYLWLAGGGAWLVVACRRATDRET
jgi:hypothetical protein